MSIRRKVPFGNHDGQRRTNGSAHHVTGIADMPGPILQVRDAYSIRLGISAGVFMPAYLVRARVGMQEEGSEIVPVIVVIDGPNKLPVESDAFQLGNDAIPG